MKAMDYLYNYEEDLPAEGSEGQACEAALVDSERSGLVIETSGFDPVSEFSKGIIGCLEKTQSEFTDSVQTLQDHIRSFEGISRKYTRELDQKIQNLGTLLEDLKGKRKRKTDQIRELFINI